MRSVSLTKRVPTRSDSGPVSVAISAGSSLGDRLWNLRRAVHRLAETISVVRISSVYETAAQDSPDGAPDFLNLALAGFTRMPAAELLGQLLRIELELGRHRGKRNAPRVIDLDLIFYGGAVVQLGDLTIPHPRYRAREFVTAPLRELGLPWVDPMTGERVASLRGTGAVKRGKTIGEIRP